MEKGELGTGNVSSECHGVSGKKHLGSWGRWKVTARGRIEGGEGDNAQEQGRWSLLACCRKK